VVVVVGLLVVLVTMRPQQLLLLLFSQRAGLCTKVGGVGYARCSGLESPRKIMEEGGNIL
jgi:hypothetical protein